MINLSEFFLEWEMFQTKVVEKIKTHIFCSETFPENRAVYEIMWKNFVEPRRPQMTVWRMRFAAWMSKATNTHSEYMIFTDFSQQQLLRERVSVFRYVHSMSW